MDPVSITLKLHNIDTGESRTEEIVTDRPTEVTITNLLGYLEVKCIDSKDYEITASKDGEPLPNDRKIQQLIKDNASIDIYIKKKKSAGGS